MPFGTAIERRRLPVATLVALLWLSLWRCAAANGAEAGMNLLNNGDFTHGSGESCDGWRTDGWVQSPTTSIFTWHPATNGNPAELEIETLHDNDARWVQTLPLSAGWYYISVEARTENASKYFTGASISILEDGIISADLRETQDWRRIGFYLRVGSRGADVDIALRLGGYMNLTRGRAFFRDARVVRVDGPPVGEQHVFDLDQIRKAEVTGPIGRPWSLVAVFLLLIGLACAGWIAFGLPPPPARGPRGKPAA